jgi:hypothetical protein
MSGCLRQHDHVDPCLGGSAMKTRYKIAACLVVVAVFGAWLIKSQVFASPVLPFEMTVPPPAPDYDQAPSWYAYPNKNGLERSTIPGEHAADEAAAEADVFFIHPTTYLKNDAYNVAIDAPTTYGDAVLLNQASAFNGCCRIYAPHYRQATLNALTGSPAAVDLAYSDVSRAFNWYLTHENHGRPFIIASHSQGSAHASRLLQQEIIGTPSQNLLVAAYVIGAYVPSDFAKIGLPVCDDAAQTNCIMSWNSNQKGRTGTFKLTEHPTYWWQGALKHNGQPAAICVNPLTWREQGMAASSANLGSLSLPTGKRANALATPLPQPTVGLTGAMCHDGVLDVDIPFFNSRYHDLLSRIYGSYHVFDYGLFYENIRRNAIGRVAAWNDEHADAADRKPRSGE